MQCMWQKAGEQNKRQQSPLAHGPPRENKASHWVSSPSICWSFEENGGQCLCEWVGLRAAQRRMAAMWSGGRRKPTSVRCNSCTLVFFFQKMWNLVYDDKILDLAHDEELWSNVLGMKIHFDTMQVASSSKIYLPHDLFWTNVKLSHITLELTFNRLKVNPLILILSPYLPCCLDFGR